MEKAKRARKAETLKQTSLRLRLRAPYLYPDRRPGNWSDPYRGTSKLAGRSKCVNCGSPEMVTSRETDCGDIGNAEPVISRRRPCQHRCLERSMLKSPGSVEDGMPGRKGQRKPGTTRGSPRRSRTAKASRISAMRRNRDVPASGADGVD
jgi:hypothetical protein